MNTVFRDYGECKCLKIRGRSGDLKLDMDSDLEMDLDSDLDIDSDLDSM